MTILLSILGSKGLAFFAFLFQEAAKGGEDLKSAFTITEMVKNLGWVALTVIVILLIMSMYSIAIMVERFLTYSAAKKQSREFAPRVAQALKNDRIEEAINISDKHKKSHLAMVVNAGPLSVFLKESAIRRPGDAPRRRPEPRPPWDRAACGRG